MFLGNELKKAKSLKKHKKGNATYLDVNKEETIVGDVQLGLLKNSFTKTIFEIVKKGLGDSKKGTFGTRSWFKMYFYHGGTKVFLKNKT